MNVFINNELKQFGETLSVSDLLKSFDLEGKKGIAIAINNAVVPKQSWNEHALKENDKVTIIRATQGG